MNVERPAGGGCVTQFDRDMYCLRCAGFLVFRDFVPLQTLQRIKEAAEQFALEVSRYVNIKGIADRSYNWPLQYTRCLYAVNTEIQDIAMDPKILRIVHEYLCNPVLRDCLLQANMVEPLTVARGVSGEVSYHRDTLWPGTTIEPMYLHAFVLLDDFTALNGATVVVPGSHGEREPGYYFKDSDPRLPQGGIRYRVYERTYFGSAVTLSAPRGSVIFLDPMCIHTQGNNVTDSTRSLVNITFRAASTTGEPPMLNARSIAERHARVRMRSDFIGMLECDSRLPAYYGPLGSESHLGSRSRARGIAT